MIYTVTYLDDMFDGLGSAIDEYTESFNDITDAMELVHQLTTHPYHCWDDDDGYTMTSNIIDVKLSFSTDAPQPQMDMYTPRTGY